MLRRLFPVRRLVPVLLIASLMLRVVVGAPCCLDIGGSAESAHPASHRATAVEMAMTDGHHTPAASHHQENDQDGERGTDGGGDGLDGDNPCCAACGPVLGPQAVTLSKSPARFAAFSPAELAALASRPQPRPYSARAPPVRA